MNPFPGLRPFTQEEDYLFFGREEQTLELLQRLGTNRFVAVVGTSGSGKSSLVRCGLLSELLGGRMLDAGAAWEIAVTHPGGNPLALLTDALLEADLYDREAEHVRENLLATLSRSHFGLVEAVKQADLGDGTNFLLVVDQFEEIFRFQDAGQRQQEAANEFVSLLLEAVAQKEVPIYVVLTMRSDFIGECGQFEGLAEMVNRGEFLIPRLTREQYKRVIEGPIKVAGGKIAPRLLQRLLNDLGQQADQLPCLQHALMRTWNVWAGRGDAEKKGSGLIDRNGPEGAAHQLDLTPFSALDLDDYQRVGKMSQALSLHADEIYDSLASDRERELCQGIFQALTVEESNNRGIRRPQRLGRLCQILDVPAEELTPIIDAYRQSGVTFLMPSPEVELTEQTIIDISHESLMRVWTRLRQWVEEETQAAGIYHRLSESADLHEQGKAGLYRDPELGIALAWRETKRPNAPWAERYRPGFSTAMGFLEASQRASVAEEQAREAAQQRELQQAQQLAEAQELRLEQQQRAARNLRKLVAGVAVVAGIAAVACVFALFARHEAGRQAEIAAARAEEARQNAEQAEHERATAEAAEAAAQRAEKRSREFRYATDIQLADRLIGDSHANARQVLDRLADHEPATGLASPSDDDLRGFEWHYLKRLVDSRGTIFATGEQPVSDTTLTTEGELVTIDEDGLLHRWDTTTQRENRPPLELKQGRNLSAMALSRDGRLIALADAKAKLVHLVDVVTGTDVRPPIPAAALFGVIFSPDGQLLVTLDSKIAWWNTTTGTMIATQDSKLSEAGTLSVSADGLTVAVPGPGWCSVFRLDHAAAQITVLMDKQSADMGSPRTAAICPDGQSLFVSQMHTGTVSAFTISSGRGVKKTTFEQASSVSAFAFDPRGTSVATACVDGSIKIWPDWKALATAGAAPQEPMPLIGHRDEVSHITFAAAGNQVISASRDRTTRLWDLGLKVASVHRTLDGVAGRRARFSPDGLMIATADLQQGRIRLRDAETGQPVRDLPVTVEAGVYPEGIAFSPDNRLLAVGFGGKPNVSYIELWDIERGERLAVLPGTTDLPGFETTAGNGVVSTSSFSPDGRFLAAGFGAIKELTVGRMGQFPLKIYDVGSRRAIRYLLGHENYCTAVAFSRDGSRMASGSSDGTARIWDTATWKTLHVLQNPFRGDLIQKIFHDVAFSPTGDLLALVSHDGTVQVWNPVNGELVQTLRGHTNGVTSVAFSPDGRTLASGSYESSVRLWNVATWREVMRLDPEIGVERHSVAFSPDGRQLLATGSPAILWTTQPLDDIPPEQAAGQLTVLLDSQVDFASYVRTHSETRRWHDTLETLVRQRPNDSRVQGAWAADRVKQFSSRQDWRQTAKSFDELNSIREHAPQEWFNTSDLLRLVTALVHESRPVEAAGLVQAAAGRMKDEGGRMKDEQSLHPYNEPLRSLADLLNERLAQEPRHPGFLELRAELAGLNSNAVAQVTDLTTAIEALAEQPTDTSAADLQRLYARRGNAQVALQHWREAVADYARCVSNATTDEALLSNQALALAELPLTEAERANQWTLLKPTEMKSAGGATLTLLADGSILASGKNPDQDAYEITVHVAPQPIKAIRLEAIPDASLPHNGPGRWPEHGNFHLNEFRVLINGTPHQSEGIVVSFSDPTATEQYRQIIDGTVDANFWSIWPQTGQRHTAVFATDIELAADDTLKLELVTSRASFPQHNLGRFRLSVSADPGADVNAQKRFAEMKLTDPWQKLAAVFDLLGQPEAIDQLVERRPKLAGKVGDLFVQNQEKDWSRAIAIYSRGITAQTTDVDLLSKRARAYEALKNWEAAAADWSRAAKENPAGAKLLTDFAGRLQNAGQHALAAAQRERARTILEQALQADPGDAPAIDALAALLLLDMSAVTEWTTLQPAELKAPFGQTLSVQEDESLVLEQIPYTLKLTEPGNSLQAIRIETAPDPAPASKDKSSFTEYQILSTNLPAEGFRGRYVRIDLPGDNSQFPRHSADNNRKYVNLSEFQIFQGDQNLALNNKARASSGDGHYAPERAVDGNTAGNDETHSYAHTWDTSNPWWEVDLGSEQAFDRMVVWNRTGVQYYPRMNHFRVQVLDANRELVFERVIDKAPSPSTEIARPVQLARVETDAADGVAHWQVSFDSHREQNPWRRLRVSVTDETTVPADAIGTPNGNWTVSQPSNVVLPAETPLTAQEDGSWIVGASEDSLSLPVLAAEVKAIRVETASGSAANETGSSAFKDYRVEAINAPRSESGGLLGRYVRLDLPGDNSQFPRMKVEGAVKCINLAELQVLSGEENVALGKMARQSSDYLNFKAALAVDGDSAGIYPSKLFAHTALNDADPWWELDLGGEQTIDRMVVWTLTDTDADYHNRMNHFRIRVLDADRNVVLEQVIDAAPKPSRAIDCRSLLVAKTPDAKADMPQWLLRLSEDSGFNPRGRFRISVTETESTPVPAAPGRVRPPTKIADPRILLAFAYARQGQTADAAIWAVKALDDATRIEGRMSLLEALGEFPDLLAELRKTRHADPALQLAHTRSLTRQGSEEVGQKQKDRSLPELTLARQEFTELLETYPEPQWTVLKPIEIKSQGGATLTPLEDGSILASGEIQYPEVYTLVARPGLEQIAGIRLEAIPDPSLPQNGPGRCTCGNFWLNELRLFSRGKPFPLLDVIVADDEAQEFRKIIDGRVDKIASWGKYQKPGEKHTAYLATRMTRAADDDLKIELHFARGLASRHNLGRFRVSVTNDPEALEAERRRIPLQIQESEIVSLDLALAKAQGRQGNTSAAADTFARLLNQTGARADQAQIIAAAVPLPGVLEQLAARAPGNTAVLVELFRKLETRGRQHLADKQVESAVADLQQFRKLFASLRSGETNWTVLSPSELKSKAGTTLTLQSDGSILASGASPDQETYTIVAPLGLARVTSVRLEALPHPSLPNGGSGRDNNGYGGVSNLTVARIRAGGTLVAARLPLQISDAVVSHNRDNKPAFQRGVDGRFISGWDMWPEVKRPQNAVFELRQQTEDPAATSLVVELSTGSGPGSHGTLGCFRISVTDDPTAFVRTAMRRDLKDNEIAKLYAALAQAQAQYGQTSDAIASFTESLHLSPDRTDRARMIATAAALATPGSEQSALDDSGRAMLRRQALEWMTTELAAWSKLLESATPQERLSIIQALTLWNESSDLASLRDPAATRADLPEAEQQAFTRLWADAAALLSKAEKTSFRALPAAEQVEAVRAELKKRNSGKEAPVESVIENGVVVQLTINPPGYRDLSPIRAIPELPRLHLSGAEVTDLSPLRGMNLTTLELHSTSVFDLSPLEGMKLRHLHIITANKLRDLSPLRGTPLESLTIYGAPVIDLTPLKEMKLTYLNCDSSQVTDLSPLKDVPLTTLAIHNTKVSDLSPIRGMPLGTLVMLNSKVSDLSPLRGMQVTNLQVQGAPVTDLSPLVDLPLTEVQCDFQPARDARVLRAIKTLAKINTQPAADFWKEVDRPLAQRLPAVLRGEDQPANNAERLDFARIAYDAKQYAFAARLWAETLESDLQAGDDRLAQIRYQAARAAVLAAAGQGQGELPEDDAATAKLRRQALAWLQAELATWTQALEAGSSPIPTRAVRALTGWTQDVDLAGLRDAQALAGLPAAERNAWRALWTDVAAVTDKAALLTQQEDERLLEQDPGNRAAATQLARGLLEQQERRDATRWTVLKPTDLKSEASATLKLLPDGSILSSGMHPNRDDYTIEVPVDLKNITAIALDILPHEIHGGNVGRGQWGGCILSEFHVSLLDESGRPQPVVMKEALADYEGTAGYEMARYVIDGQNDEKGWGTPQNRIPHRLVVKPEHPITGSSTVLRIALRQNHFNDAHKLGLLIGRFRLSATDDPRALDQERSRFAVPKITDPWAKLAAAYVLAGDTQRAADLLARSVEKIDIAALLDSGCLTHEVVDSLQARHPDSYAGLLPRLALSAGERGKLELARDLHERLVKLQPENELWKERVEQFRAGAIAVWNFDAVPEPWTPVNHCELTVKDGVLTARTLGDDPNFMTAVNGPVGGKAVVLRYRTDEPFTIQVFWGDSTGGLADSRHRDYPIPASPGAWREITLPFWCQGTLNALRLDPNTAKEHPLEIDSIVLRQVEPSEAWNQASDGATRTAIFEAVSRNDDLLFSLVEQFPDAPQWQFALARSLTARGQQALTAGQIDQAISLLQQAQQAYARVSAPTQWTVLTPTEFSSVGGETFTAENDGSIFVSGPNPDRAVYTLKLKTELHTVTAIRLETIPDPRLPQGGAGRYRENGNFHVSELTSAIVSGDAQESSTPIVISSVIADNEQFGSAQNMLDGNPQTRWDTYPNRGPHWAVFGMTTPVQVDGGSLSITLDSGITEWGQHGLGRFRLLVTGETDAFTRTAIFTSLNPNEIADASVALASAQAQQGQKKEALASFTQAIELATDRAGQVRVIAAAAPLPGMLEILAKRGAGNGQFQAELARHFAEQGDASSAAAAQTIARALFEQRLAAAPDDAELASELARLLLSPATDSDATRWTVLQPTEMKSEKGATLTLQADGSILASGTNTAGDVYTLRAVADVDRIAAVRLEAMPDSSLPNQGPGRHSSGNFQLTAFRVYDAENDGGSGLTPLPLASAWASFDYKANDADIAGIVDETVQKVWHVWGRFGEAHQAVFGVAKTAAAASRGRSLVIELRHKDFGEGINLGRFRLAVNADPDAFDREQNRSAAMKIVDPWVKLAAAYRLVGDQSALDKLFERHPAAAAGVGDQYAAEKNWERAIALYGRVITDATTEVALLSKRAAAHVGAGNWNLAQVDWWRIVAQQPDQTQAAFDVFQKAERWNEAAEFGLHLVQFKRNDLLEDTLVWLRVAPVLALADDQEAYANYCDRMARHFADSDLPEVPDRIIKAALLRPDSINVAKLPGIRLGKILDDGIGPDGLLPWAWGSRALWAYRSGDAQSAVKFVAKSEELKPAEVAHAMNLTILALAQIRLERLDEARQTLKLAQEAIRKLEADPSKRGHDLLIARILYREAERRINGEVEP